MSECVREMTRQELVDIRRELIDENVKLKTMLDAYYKEKNDYKCKIEEMQSRIDCLKAELAEVQECRESDLERRHQQDCITINQLQTTIDVLVGRYAKLREMKGL